MKNKKILSIAMASITLLSCIFGMSLVQKTGASETVEETNFENETTEENFESHGTISIEGVASIEVGPDLLVIILKVSALDPDSANKATEEVAKKLDQVINALERIGISKSDIGSNTYSIKQVYEWTYYPNGNRKEKVFKGYKAVNTLRVEVKDFDKGGKVIDVAADAGVLVNSIHFELTKEKRNELKIQAMEMAAKDAKLKAETISSALDEEIGRVKSVNMNKYNYQPYEYWNRKGYSSIGVDNIVPPTTILPSDLTVSVTVNVIWELI